jgi:hypothetical protein
MKKMKKIIGQFLLIIMAVFVCHDYFVGQTPATPMTRCLHKPLTAQHHCPTVEMQQSAEQHQIFHIAALPDPDDTAGKPLSSHRAIFAITPMRYQDLPESFFVPPKHA